MKPFDTRDHSLKVRLAKPLGLGAALIGLACGAPSADAQTYALSNSWTQFANSVLTTNTLDNSSSDQNRGFAYYAASNEVLLVNKSKPIISSYDGTTGALLVSNLVNMTGVSGGNFAVSKLGLGTDGFLYGANLQTPIGAAGLKVYQWQNFANAPYNAYTGSSSDAVGVNLTGKRVGDTFAITGGGTSTEILAGIGGINDFVLLSTTDGSNFTSSVLNVASGLPAPGSGVQFGIAFYTNNTFLVEPDSANTLYLVQFPANFATYGTTIVPATVLASVPLTGNWLDLAYDRNSGLLAVHGNATRNYNLYSLPANNFLGLALLATNALPFTTSTGLNGNETGDIAIGSASGSTNVYVLESNAGLEGANVLFTAGAQPPTFAATPTGGTVYTNDKSFTFSVSAQGTPPLSYFWYAGTSSDPASGTLIPNATNSTYTVSPLTVGASGWYFVVVSNSAQAITSAPVQLTVVEPLASAYVTTLWSLPADNSAAYLDTGYNTRGLAFDPMTTNVVVAEHAQANIFALNALTGQLRFQLTTPSTGLPNGSIFPVGQVGVADDGALYVCNVSSYQPGQQQGNPGDPNDVNFSIIRFNAVVPPGDTNYIFDYAFEGDPGAFWPGNPGGSSQDRWGDSMAVRGGGTNTEILLGTYETLAGNGFGTGPGTNVSILTTEDGLKFDAHTIAVTNAPDGFSYLGVAWGSNNTFWAKSPGYDLRQVQYDLASGIGWVIQDFATTASAGSLDEISGIGLDISNNILAGVNLGDTPNDLELFQIPTSGFPPEPYFQAFFPTNNANINGNCATTIKFPYIFSLDANNGIIGLKYSIPLLQFPITAETVSGHSVTLSYQTVGGHTYHVQYSGTLPPGNGVWTNLDAGFTATGYGVQTVTDTNVPDTDRFYRVVGQ
ncbi:MAG TPA: hypothetical protein VHB20_03905 [Verrucomicrobiae bacterium]|jgi:hypothetical protein|nr:hypothetical protein [Verrucomicrobiae bacterium]